MKILIIFAVVSLVTVIKSNENLGHGAVDCAMGSSSCESCHAAYPFCYWCDGKCRQYFGKNIAKIECRGRVMYESCEEKSKTEPNVEEMLGILAALKTEHNKEQRLTNFEENSSKLFAETKNTSQKSKLKHLLKLLKMLAYIQKLKQKNHSSHKGSTSTTDNENELFNLGENPNMIGKGGEGLHPSNQKSSNSDLEALIRLVGEGKHTEAPLSQRGSAKINTVSSTKTPNAKEKVNVMTSSIVSPLPSSRNPGTENWSNLTRKPTVYSNLTKTTSSGKYCELFEQEDECNGDQDCSWCNILDICVGRNNEDFKRCTGTKKNEEINVPISDESNICAGRTSCASCTKKGKCYWCEKTKSCHIYPFFGFIPHNCPTNMWYYKECDVQLAIFIILFPLLMILLSMGVFYVCLRYCYYRRRTLKVKLFEKPEIFERKKGKKVYFVGGDDDEDEELRSEQIRKKYNLPQEKEPLITP